MAFLVGGLSSLMRSFLSCDRGAESLTVISESRRNLASIFGSREDGLPARTMHSAGSVWAKSPRTLREANASSFCRALCEALLSVSRTCAGVKSRPPFFVSYRASMERAVEANVTPRTRPFQLISKVAVCFVLYLVVPLGPAVAEPCVVKMNDKHLYPVNAQRGRLRE